MGGCVVVVVILLLLLLGVFFFGGGGICLFVCFVLLGFNESDISCIDSGTASAVSSHFNQPLQRTGLND